MGPLEEGARISIKTSDDIWITGTFLGLTEEADNSYYVLDIGRPTPRRINSGFVVEIEEAPSGDLISPECWKDKPVRLVK